MIKTEKDGTIGENTKIRLGLVSGLIVLLVAGTWWAASVTGKLDTVINNQSKFQTEVNRLDNQHSKLTTEHAGLKNRIDLMDATGTSRLKADEEKIKQLELRLNTLERLVHSLKPE